MKEKDLIYIKEIFPRIFIHNKKIYRVAMKCLTKQDYNYLRVILSDYIEFLADLYNDMKYIDEIKALRVRTDLKLCSIVEDVVMDYCIEEHQWTN